MNKNKKEKEKEKKFSTDCFDVAVLLAPRSCVASSNLLL